MKTTDPGRRPLVTASYAGIVHIEQNVLSDPMSPSKQLLRCWLFARDIGSDKTYVVSHYVRNKKNH